MSVHLFCGSERNLSVLRMNNLRSKRFQSSYCAKVRAEAKKKVEGGGGGETLATQAKERKIIKLEIQLSLCIVFHVFLLYQKCKKHRKRLL